MKTPTHGGQVLLKLRPPRITIPLSLLITDMGKDFYAQLNYMFIFFLISSFILRNIK